MKTFSFKATNRSGRRFLHMVQQASNGVWIAQITDYAPHAPEGWRDTHLLKNFDTVEAALNAVGYMPEIQGIPNCLA